MICICLISNLQCGCLSLQCKLPFLFVFSSVSSFHLYHLFIIYVSRGSVPSPRSKHVAAIYDDRLLLVFGGASKSKYLNDLYALDFEAVRCFPLKYFSICWPA